MQCYCCTRHEAVERVITHGKGGRELKKPTIWVEQWCHEHRRAVIPYAYKTPGGKDAEHGSIICDQFSPQRVFTLAYK